MIGNPPAFSEGKPGMYFFPPVFFSPFRLGLWQYVFIGSAVLLGRNTMRTLTGKVLFWLQDALPFTVSYTATVDADGQVVEIFDTIEDAACDIYKHDLEWKYSDAMQEAVALDVQRQMHYLSQPYLGAVR